MSNSIYLHLFLLLLFFSSGCSPVMPDDGAFDADKVLMEYFETDLPIGRYIVENKAHLGYVDTLADFKVRMFRPEIPEVFSGSPCLIIQDLETGQCYSACRPVMYYAFTGGNAKQTLNPIPGIGRVSGTILYHKDHCSNLIALEPFLNDKFGDTGIPEGFLEDFLNTYFRISSSGSGVEPTTYEELEEMVKAELKGLDEDIEGKDFIQAYSWELASTLARIKEAERVN
ncbi:MAG: hypothetical protein KDE33_27430, partial [Bacteroidetes bacterium]|nr:hypothetical protein [Bacteroidota bacterium]